MYSNVCNRNAIVHFGTLGTSAVVHIGSHGKQRVKDFIKLLLSVSALSLSGNLFYKIGDADANARSP